MSNIIHVFIDASSLWVVQKSAGKLLDLDNLRAYLEEKHEATSIEVYYYAAYPKEDTRNYDTAPMHGFLTSLKKSLGFTVRKKEIKQIRKKGSEHEFVEKGNMDVELTIDAVHTSTRFDTAILITGDSDFLALIKFLQARGKKVYAYSSKPYASREIMQDTDGYTDILSIDDPSIWRTEIIRREDLDQPTSQ